MKRGHPPVFSPAQEIEIAKLVQAHRVVWTQAILAEDSPLRNKDIFPESLKVSQPTIAKAAKKHGVDLHRGRPSVKKAA